MIPQNRHLEKALTLADELLGLADRGEAEAEDDTCRILYGQMRDFGYRIRQLAEAEQARHINKHREGAELP